MRQAATILELAIKLAISQRPEATISRLATRVLPQTTRVIRIGTQGTQKATYLAGVRGVNVTGGVAVMVTSTGQLGVVSSHGVTRRIFARWVTPATACSNFVR